MFKLAIFDLDGTLLDSLADLASACNHALSECGFPEHRVEEYKLLVGRGIYNLFRGAMPPEAVSDENVQRMASLFLPWYSDHKCDFTTPYDGILEMLELLTERGVALAVASNKYQEGAQELVSRYFGEFPFVKVYGQLEGRPIKPDPTIVEQIMESMAGITKEEVVYVGDSNVDMQTGLNAGVATIGVTWGFRSREELLALRPTYLADNPFQLSEFILGGGIK